MVWLQWAAEGMLNVICHVMARSLHRYMILSLPLVVGQVAMIGVWTADIVMLGWISTDALAAGTQANRLYQPFYFIALGLTLAVSPLTAQALGAGSRRQARRVMRQGLWLAVVYG